MAPAADLTEVLRQQRAEPPDMEMFRHIRPLRDLCLVLIDEAPKATAGGIVMPDVSRDQPVTGFVVAVGRRCTSVAVGDYVVFGKWNGKPLSDERTRELGFEPERLYIMRAVDETAPHVYGDHILAKLVRD
jgi:co-chaperonin GroES (HSP10)